MHSKLVLEIIDNESKYVRIGPPRVLIELQTLIISVSKNTLDSNLNTYTLISKAYHVKIIEN